MIYLDHAATTPLDPRVLEAMQPWMMDAFNASSVHRKGQDARARIEEAREYIAGVIGCQNQELLFTSGGTEANNFAVMGVMDKHPGGHLVCSAIEHPSVLEACRKMESKGCELTVVPVDHEGILDPDIFAAHVRDDTVLVSVMMANNEIGVVQPIESLRRSIPASVLFHSDIVQGLPWLNVDVQELGIDLASFCAHKLGGPRGIGALYVKDKTPISPLLVGGMQEFRKRAGTEHVAAIVGFAEALRIREEKKSALTSRLSILRDAFVSELLEVFPAAVLNGSDTHRLPNNINVSFPDTSGETLVINLDLKGFCVSSGSACHAGLQTPSHVVMALGDPWRASSCLRISLGEETRDADLQSLLSALKELLV